MKVTGGSKRRSVTKTSIDSASDEETDHEVIESKAESKIWF